MAVTSIWKVEGRLARVLGYAGNPDKAEGSPTSGSSRRGRRHPLRRRPRQD